MLIFSIELHESLQPESNKRRRDGNGSAEGIWEYLQLREVYIKYSVPDVGRPLLWTYDFVDPFISPCDSSAGRESSRRLIFMTLVSFCFVLRTHPPVTRSSRFNYISAIFLYNYN